MIYTLGVALDATEIAPLLYQGSVPPEGQELTASGFHLLLLCAREHQPPATRFPGVRVYYCPSRDTPDPTARELAVAWEASRVAADAIARGQKVLVTCFAGLNRSGLVVGFTLVRLGIRPKDAVRLVQSRRALSLNNPTFVQAIEACRPPSSVAPGASG